MKVFANEVQGVAEFMDKFADALEWDSNGLTVYSVVFNYDNGKEKPVLLEWDAEIGKWVIYFQEQV